MLIQLPSSRKSVGFLFLRGRASNNNNHHPITLYNSLFIVLRSSLVFTTQYPLSNVFFLPKSIERKNRLEIPNLIKSLNLYFCVKTIFCNFVDLWYKPIRVWEFFWRTRSSHLRDELLMLLGFLFFKDFPSEKSYVHWYWCDWCYLLHLSFVYVSLQILKVFMLMLKIQHGIRA